MICVHKSLCTLGACLAVILPLLGHGSGARGDVPASILITDGSAVASPEAFASKHAYESTGCAAVAAYLALRLEGAELTFEQCLARLPRRPEGNSVREVLDALGAFGVASRAYSVTPEELAGVRRAAIVLADARPKAERWSKIGHYFVVRPVGEDFLQVLDAPANPPRVMARTEFLRVYRKKAGQRTVICTLSDGAGTELGDLVKPLTADNRSAMLPLTQPAVINSISSTPEVIAVYDLNKILTADRSDFDIQLKNNTPTALEIVAVTATCGCLTPSTAQREIAPGGVAVVSTAIDLKGRSGPISELVSVQLRSVADEGLILLRLVADPQAGTSGTAAGQ